MDSVKNTRACMSCYNSVKVSLLARRVLTSIYELLQCHPGPNVDCCTPCKGKNRYCRGPIQAPVLINIREYFYVAPYSIPTYLILESWFGTTFASIQSQCNSIETIVKERSVYSLSIHVNKTGAIERYDVDLQSINGHATSPYDPSSLARVLDTVYPADQKGCLDNGSLAPRHIPDQEVEVRGA